MIGVAERIDRSAGVAPNAKGLSHFGLEVKDRPRVGLVGLEKGEGAPKKVEEIANGGFPLASHLEKKNEVGGRESSRVAFAYAEMRAGDRQIPEGVEVTGAAFDEFDFGLVEKVEVPMKSAPGVAGPFGDRLDKAVFQSTPMDDETGFGQPKSTNDDGAVFLH